MPDPSTKLLDDRIQKAVDAALEKSQKSGDSGGGGGGMEYRIELIEKAVQQLRSDANGLMEASGRLVLDVAEIKGKVSQMPTAFQLATWMAGYALALAGIIFAVLKLAQP